MAGPDECQRTHEEATACRGRDDSVNEYPHYSTTIQWSDDDGVYGVSFPFWDAAGHIAHTHGATYEEAVGQGRQALELLMESAREIGTDLPAPHTFAKRQAV